MRFKRVSGPDAYKTSMGNDYAKWPARTDKHNRLFPRCEPAFSPSFQLEAGESVFTIGSCFARNVEAALKDRGFKVPALDFEAPPEETFANGLPSQILNKYTPFGMLNEVDYAFGSPRALPAEAYLVEGVPGAFMDYQIHVTKPVSLERGIERRNEVRDNFKSGIQSSRVIIITLGLVEAWLDTENGIYLNETPSFNMVKKYPSRFEFEVLSFDETYACVVQMIDLLREVRGSDLRVVLTVSPVPIQRTFTGNDIISANTYSKALLRVVAEGIVRKYDFVDYFPSFESVTLSDNNFSWKDDQVHVTNEAVEFNIGRMVAGYTGNAA